MAQTALQQLKKSKVDVFRRFSIRRRLDDSSGDYETDWQDLSQYVMKWGSLSWSMDAKKFNFFSQRGLTITLDNTKGLFDHEKSSASFWHNFLTRYRTLVKIEAGFVDPDDGSDIPNPSVLFYGIMASEDIKQSDNLTVSFNLKSLTAILDETPANKCLVASGGSVGSLTASDLIARIRDVTDGSANFILQKFISSTAWNISATSNILASLNTTTQLDNTSCWGLAKKMAEAENKVVYIDRSQQFNFVGKDEAAAVTFSFVGFPYHDTTYGHTIKRISNYQDDIDLLYNRVIAKHDSSDTSTSYTLKEEAWTVGDSSTSWKYGVRTLSFTNEWMSTTMADNVASSLFADLNTLKLKVDIITKFIPQLDLLDKVTVQYDPDSRVEGSKWDQFNWDEGVWSSDSVPYFAFQGEEFKIIKMKHSLDKLESTFTIREI